MRRRALPTMLTFVVGVAIPFVATGAPHPPSEAAGSLVVDADKKMDLALERFYADRHQESSGIFFELLRALPENDLRRDAAEFHLAASLGRLGYGQAAIELFVDVVTARRSPEFVARSLVALERMVQERQLDEARLIDQVLFGNQFGDLGPETAAFVEYYQALGEIRRGFSEWAGKRLEALSRSDGFYGWKARFALAVEHLAKGNDEGAEKVFRGIGEAETAPAAIRNDARQALARQLYEHKRYDEAFAVYNTVDAPLLAQDTVLLEKAWDRVAASDEQRALGMVIGLGAPIYHRLFAPEQALIQAVALKRLCQFGAAHRAVLDFRGRYGELLKKIRDRQPVAEDPLIERAAMGRDLLRWPVRWRERLAVEQGRLGRLSSATLRGYLEGLYGPRRQQAEEAIARQRERATDQVIEELLRIDEQMTILDYEIGVGLFKAGRERSGAGAARSHGRIPYGSGRVYYRFSGEYWSDELQDFSVLADDRCIR